MSDDTRSYLRRLVLSQLGGSLEDVRKNATDIIVATRAIHPEMVDMETILSMRRMLIRLCRNQIALAQILESVSDVD